MFKVNIVKLPEKVLREKSKDVPIPLKQEDIELAEKMIYHVDDSQTPNTKFRPAVGVAAVQYGVLKRVFYIHVKDINDNTVFRDVIFNPKVISHSNTYSALAEGEGCLSVRESWPGQKGYVPRYSRIIVDGYSYLEKKQRRYDAKGYVAIVFQHELDHLDGKLFIDRIDRKQPWNKRDNMDLL